MFGFGLRFVVFAFRGCVLFGVCLLVCGWSGLIVGFVVYLLLLVGLVRLFVLVALLLLIVLICCALVLVIGFVLLYWSSFGVVFAICLGWLGHVVIVCGLVTYGCCVFVRLFVLVVFGWLGLIFGCLLL